MPTYEGPPRALEEAVRARKARAVGAELRFQCPYPERHQNGDADPSARYHPEKGVWCCDVCGGSGGWVDLCKLLDVERPRQQHVRQQHVRPQVVAHYDYRSEDGEPVRRKLRWEPGFKSGSKSFTWQKPDGAGGWTSCKGDGNPGLLYGSERLPEARRQKATLLVVEGEKDCDTACGLGWVAVCNPEGASRSIQRSKWRRGYSEQLTELSVVIIADKDPPGHAHARAVARNLEGLARDVRYLELPGDGVKDLSNWVEAQRRTGADEPSIRQALDQVVETAIPIDEIEEGNEEEEDETATQSTDDKRDQANLLEALTKAKSLEAIEPIVRQLASLALALDRLERGILREKVITTLQGKVSSPAALFDAALRSKTEREAPASGRAITFIEPPPWPVPVDGSTLLHDLGQLFRRFVALAASAPETLALWVVHTYTYQQSEVSPLLLISSPEKRCGKTTLLTLLAQLVHRPLSASNITPAALFRTIEAHGPTLLIDEADTFLHQSDELRGVLNSGHSRATAFVVRTVGDDHEPRQFSTWSPKAVALIGRPPSTLEDRSIILTMRRKTQEEKVERLRLDRLDLFTPYGSRLVRWANDHAPKLHGHDPQVPTSLNDRAADNWRPLLAIAETVGPPWPAQARKAIAQLTHQDTDDDSSPGVLLLADIRAIFDRRSVEVLASQDLVSELIERDDRPWPEWRRGQPLSTVQLARLLKPFGVRPKQIRCGAIKIRGYARADFGEPFARYLPPESVHPVQPFDVNNLGPKPRRYTRSDQDTPEQPLSTNAFNDVPPVPPRDPVQTPISPPEREVIEL